MKEFARDALLESIKAGDIQAAQKILEQMEKRGLTLDVKEVAEV